MTVTDPAVLAREDAAISLFDITDHITIDFPEGARTVELWCPVIGDGAFQRVLDIEVTSEDPYDLTRETEFGNLMLHSRLCAAKAGSWSIRYVVERRTIGLVPDPARARPLATAHLFARALTPEAHVDVDKRTRALAQDIVGPETNPLEQAGRIYDYVTGAMDYDTTKQSFLGSTEHALTCSVGNCNDIHALFVSLCRSAFRPDSCSVRLWSNRSPKRSIARYAACLRIWRPTTSPGRPAAISCRPRPRGRAGACSSPDPMPKLTAKLTRCSARSVSPQCSNRSCR